MGGTCSTHGDYRISEEKIPLRIRWPRYEINVKMEFVKIMWIGVKFSRVGSKRVSI